MVDADPPHDQHTFDDYLRWLHRCTRTHIKTPYTKDVIDEDSYQAPLHSEEDVIKDVYNIATREETQP